MQLGKGAFFNVVHPGFFALSLVSFCTTVSVSLLIHYCLIYKLILLSSESENGKTGTCHRSALWDISETSIYSNTRCIANDSLLPHYSCLFFKIFFCPFPIWLFICRFVSSLLLNLPFTGELLHYYGFIVQLAQMHDDSFEYFKLMWIDFVLCGTDSQGQ